MDRNDVKDLIFQEVSVGVPHQVIPGRLFYHFGILEEANDLYVKIRMEHGVRQIPYDEIMEIKLRGR